MTASPDPQAAAAWMERDCPDGLSWSECRNDDCGVRVDGRGCLTDPKLPERTQSR